ncbi:hypothetical protein V5799_013772 [Amblyomma americanum]|uniref:Peptidase M13 C-terminal domain-containing protein n=1 Tax=Amblyomma americanum TaxID=6943 RepID=A0AAQ4E505_AMBAM
MYTSCLTRKPAAKHAVKEFMIALGLQWLEQSESEANAFGVLLDLAYNWQAPLWFRAAVLPQDAYHPVRRVLISLNVEMIEWRASLEEMISTDEYRKYWSEKEGLKDSVIFQRYETTMTIFLSFLDRVSTPTDAPRQFSLGDSSNHINIATNLTVLLNERVKPSRNFSEEDLMIFEQASLLEGINAAFSMYGNQELLIHICWLFRDVYGPIADPSLLLLHGRSRNASQASLRYCAHVVEASYQLLVSALFTVSRLTLDQRQFISGLLTAIHHEGVELVRNVHWLEWRSKSMAIAKFEDMHTVLWPRDELLTNDGLSTIYRVFPDNASSFREYWLATRRAIRSYTAHDPEGSAEVLDAPGNIAAPLVSYVHALNAVLVSVAALATPLFNDSGTQAMQYGSLGYQYARQMVRALDGAGTSVDLFGNLVPRWLSEASAARYEKRVKCFGAVDSDIFPDVPALEVAYSAYRRASKKQAPKLFPKMTEAQVFFITVCLGMCQYQWGHSAGDCNKAMISFRPFAEAFQCDSGSSMRLAAKCGFFH